MRSLPKFDEISLSTFRDLCNGLSIDVAGDKATLVAILAAFEIDTIAAELCRSERSNADPRRIIQKLQRAVEARVDQVYKDKKQYLVAEMEEIKAELINIKVVRNEEKKEPMKRYKTEALSAKEKKKAASIKDEKPGSSRGLWWKVAYRGNQGKSQLRDPPSLSKWVNDVW